MSNQHSRKVFIGTTELQDDIDAILDLYTEGRANLDQVAKAINDLKKQQDSYFSLSGEEHEAVTDDWDADSIQAKPFDWEND